MTQENQKYPLKDESQEEVTLQIDSIYQEIKFHLTQEDEEDG